jgi:hypothetical protein
MNGKIRKFQEKDAPMLAEIFGEAFTDEVAGGMQPMKAERIVELSERESAKTFVFESDKFT